MNSKPSEGAVPLAKTGITGLDDILNGGLTTNRMYLLEGMPGTGKSTLAMQFLLEGSRLGEPVLYVILSETEEEIRAVAAEHGWRLDGVTIREITSSESTLDQDDQYTMYHPSEVELSDTTKTILADVERLKPRRVVIDSLSELRLMCGSSLRFRRQILALKKYFNGRKCTMLLLDDLTSPDHDLQIQSLAHGVLSLTQTSPEYGAERRRVRVLKYRGAWFRGGYHDFQIVRGGLRVYPRLVAAEHRQPLERERFASGITGLDSLLGGGLEGGTSTLIVGAAGTGKSSIAAQFCATAAQKGHAAAMFIFDESTATLLTRCEGLGIPLKAHLQGGKITIQPVDPAELSPGEFASVLRSAVEERGAKVVVIDSLNGYLQAMPDERFLTVQLHELLMYLGQQGVATILVGAHSGIIGTQMHTPADISYLSDAVMLLRNFEAHGEVRQAISIVKKRGSAHERTIREFRMTDGRISVGKPLREFHGVLTGVPQFKGTTDALSEGTNE